MELLTRRWTFITLVGSWLAVFCFGSTAAQEGYYGVGHDKWHQNFYSKLKRNDGQGSCCNLMDCRPTQSRMVGDHYEVKVDGEWIPVPNNKINNVVAPDGGAHVCAPKQPTKVFCSASSFHRRAKAHRGSGSAAPRALAAGQLHLNQQTSDETARWSGSCQFQT
jgi:hypothetical protein